MKLNSKVTLTYGQLKALLKEAVEGDDDESIPLSSESKLHWDYIVDTKGYDYLAAALLKRFRLTDPAECDRFLKDLFLSIHSDMEKGRSMRKNRREELD